jgi:3-deoxy-D-manno-octulosonic-acid transferase
LPTRKAWDNAEYEGKALRRVFNQLLKRFEKMARDEESDIEKLGRLGHMLTVVAKTKQDLAKYEYQDKRIKELEAYIDSRQLTRYIEVEGDMPVIA